VRAVILARLSDEAGKDSPIDSQISACRAFLERKGWPLVYEPFSEKTSGYHDVQRLALAEVEALIAKRAIDVVVVNDFERLARTEERRFAALYHARRYGVEYRFASLPNGKLDDSPMGKLYASVLHIFGEMERDKILARTSRGRLDRATRGVPSGGGNGVPFGYRYVGKPPYETWERNDEEAALLLWMAETLATEPGATARSLERDLDARGIRTRRGHKWHAATISAKMRNELYCGRGRLFRWKTVWDRAEVEEDDGPVNRDIRSRIRRPLEETLPIAENAVPILIPPSLFDAVQRKLAANSTQSGGAEPRTPLPDGFTLLHHGLIVCARCGIPMARHRRELAQGVVGYYMCSAKVRDHNATCAIHSIIATKTDDLVLRVVAEALADPERVVALADAADVRLERATTSLAIVESHLGAARERLRELDADERRFVKILGLLDAATDAEMIATYRARLEALTNERTRIIEREREMSPQRAQVEAGVAMLAALREGRLLTRVLHDGRTYDLTNVTRSDLLTLTGGSPEQVAKLAREAGAKAGDATDQALFAEWFEHTPMEQADLAYLLLSSFMPPNEQRNLLRVLNVQVRISPPRTKEERKQYGYFAPAWTRIAVQMGDLLLFDGAKIFEQYGAAGTECVAHIRKTTPISASSAICSRSPTKPGVKGPSAMPASR
jgi:DNA invertase Pin-like site-specific DNA recombinase